MTAETLPMSLRSYAKRRGVSAMAVSTAIRAGRLVASVTRDAVGNPKIADPDLADREWEANTDHAKRVIAAGGDPAAYALPRPTPSPSAAPHALEVDAAPPVTAGPGEPSLAESAAHAKFWDAKLKELKFREAAKELIPAVDVERRMADVFSTSRVKLLGIPSRAKQALPHLTSADVTVIEDLVREALEDLARGGSGEGDA